MNLQIKETGPVAAPTIVFLHGLGVSSWMWNEQIESLQNDYHCVSIDLPGNGESYTSEWLSFADTAKQVADIIRTHSPNGKAHLVGLSLGSYVTLFLLQQHPEVVDTVVISGVTTKPFTPHWLWSSVFRVMPSVLRWQPIIKLSAKLMHLPPEAAALYQRDSKRLSKLTYSRVYQELLYFRLPTALASRPHRLLAVAGDKEVQSIQKGLADFAKLMPNTSARLVPNAHHGWNGEHPQLFSQMIRAWVEHCPLPPDLTPSHGQAVKM